MDTTDFAFARSRVTLRDGADFRLSGTIRVNPGRPTLIVGENGSGKSLTRVTDAAANPQAPLGAGLVRQEPLENFVGRIAADEIVLPLVHSQTDARTSALRVDELLTGSGISPEQLSTPAAKLNAGALQHLAVLTAVVPQPEVLLLDEVLSRLDTDGRKRVGECLYRLNRDALVVAATHRPAEFVAALGEHGRTAVIVRATRNGQEVRLTSEAHRPSEPIGTLEAPNVASIRAFGGDALTGGGLAVESAARRLLSLREVQVRDGMNLVIGQNGSGKTLLLKALAGLIPMNPLRRIGRDIYATGDLAMLDKESLSSLSKRGASAFFPDEPDWWISGFTVRQQLDFYQSRSDDQSACDVLNVHGINVGDSLDRLSYGQRKLVALTSIPENLRIVCLDEPFADLSRQAMTSTARLIQMRLQSGSWQAVVAATNEEELYRDVISAS